MSDISVKFVSPYPGLRPFERDEADLFFGRETQINEMLIRLEDQPDFKFLAVLGASGSGKSSLVRAGLIPALDRGFLLGAPAQWKFVIARPGEAPLRNLAEAWVEAWHPQPESPEPADVERHKVNVEFTLAQLRGGPLGIVRAYRGDSATKDHAVLVLIDQFEELFRFRRERDSLRTAAVPTPADSTTDDTVQDAQQAKETEQEKQRNESASFVELLLMTAQQTDVPIYVAITMRSEFLGDCDAFMSLPESISRSQYLTPRMTRSQLSEAVTRPLEIPEFQARIEPALVTRILNDIGTDPDQLPLMQHALMRTWQHARMESRRMGTPARPLSASDATLSTEETGKSARPTELQIADYEHVGRVSGALDKHANEIFNALGDETTRARLQRVAERLFCSLSERRDGSPLVRRPITVKEAAFEIGDDQTSDKHVDSCDSSSEHPVRILSIKAAQQGVMTVAKAFQKANLLVFSPPDQSLSLDTRIDISHESLLRNWSRLNDWRMVEEEAATQYRSLVRSAQEYFLNQGELLHGLGLQTALRCWNHESVPATYGWTQRYVPGTYGVARQYLDLSRDKQERLQQQAEAAATEKAQASERELKLAQDLAASQKQRALEAEIACVRFRRRTKAALASCVVAVVFLGFALIELRDAMNATATAVQKEAEAKSAETKAKTAEGDAIEQRRIAEINLAEAKRQEGIATENAKEASRQELIAKANQDEAEKQRKIADDLRKRATNVANEAEKQSLKLIKDVKIQPYIYYFVEALPDLSDGGVPSDLLEKAWAKWQNVAGIRVGLVHTAKDANVIVKTSPEGLSGPPMLAHVGPPRDGVQLELTFNAQVSWDTDKFESHVCHEIGHILGLTHTTTPGQLMYPIAQAGIKSPQSEDIQRIRAIWGDLPPPISIK